MPQASKHSAYQDLPWRVEWVAGTNIPAGFIMKWKCSAREMGYIQADYAACRALPHLKKLVADWSVTCGSLVPPNENFDPSS